MIKITDQGLLDQEFDIEESFDIEEFDKLDELQDRDFPDLPFVLLLFESVDEYNEIIDKPFMGTKSNVIFVKDSRIMPENYYYKDFPCLHGLYDYLKVEGESATPVTLREVLKAMEKSEHYNNSIVKEDPHQFLESFDKQTEIQYETFFGS